jgi:hypothetical protein
MPSQDNTCYSVGLCHGPLLGVSEEEGTNQCLKKCQVNHCIGAHKINE